MSKKALDENVIREFLALQKRSNHTDFDKDVVTIVSGGKRISIPRLFLEYRKLFQKASSHHTMQRLYENICDTIPKRYKDISTIQYGKEKIADVMIRRDFFKKHIKTGKVLDIGCDDGYFTVELAKRKGMSVTGIDMIQKKIISAKKYAEENKVPVTFIVGFAEELPFKKNTFDTTILSHILEHVHTPEKAIDEAYRVTKDGGRIIAIVPISIGREPSHIRYITKCQLIRLLGKHGHIIGEYRSEGRGVGYIIKVMKR